MDAAIRHSHGRFRPLSGRNERYVSLSGTPTTKSVLVNWCESLWPKALYTQVLLDKFFLSRKTCPCVRGHVASFENSVCVHTGKSRRQARREKLVKENLPVCTGYKNWTKLCLPTPQEKRDSNRTSATLCYNRAKSIACVNETLHQMLLCHRLSFHF